MTRDKACTDLATSRCAELMMCSAADLDRRWPDLTTCEAREKLACMDGLAAPQTAATPATVQACADALTETTCDAFLSGVTPPAACLAQHGPRATGAACAYPAQCASGFCALADGSLCGTCAAPPVAGDSCAMQGCGPALVCVRTTLLCQTPIAAGGTCDHTLPCGAGLACVGATATTQGTCQAQVATAGGTCDPKRATVADCSAAAGLVCDTASLTCVVQPTATAGMPCGLVGTAPTRCAGGATCEIPQGEKVGTCIAPAADGAACNTDSGPDCETPARCVNGTCQLAGSQSC